MITDSATLGQNEAEMWVVADDGFPLAATRFKARAERLGVVVIAPAAGVPRRFYRPFARALATRGWDVLTWDSRGISDSRLGVSWRDERLSMEAWGALDLTAVIDRACRRAGHLPVAMVGHSDSGHLLGLASNAHRLSALALIACPHPWLGHLPFAHQLRMNAFWRLFVPLVSNITGRLPQYSAFGVEPIPVGVTRQMVATVLRRNSLNGHPGFEAVTAPIMSISFGDDHLAPESSVTPLLNLYSSASSRDHSHLDPAEMNLGPIGHFGFFSQPRVDGLWQQLFEFLADQSPQSD